MSSEYTCPECRAVTGKHDLITEHRPSCSQSDDYQDPDERIAELERQLEDLEERIAKLEKKPVGPFDAFFAGVADRDDS